MWRTHEVLARMTREKIESAGYTVATFQVGDAMELRAIDREGDTRYTVRCPAGDDHEAFYNSMNELARLLKLTDNE